LESTWLLPIGCLFHGWRNWSTHWVCSDTFHALFF
jgi:hypothetical protein